MCIKINVVVNGVEGRSSGVICFCRKLFTTLFTTKYLQNVRFWCVEKNYQFSNTMGKHIKDTLLNICCQDLNNRSQTPSLIHSTKPPSVQHRGQRHGWSLVKSLQRHLCFKCCYSPTSRNVANYLSRRKCVSKCNCLAPTVLL